MPVLPCRVHPFQDCKTLYEFLSLCQQKSIEKNHAQIASIVIEIEPVDPLAVLQEMVQPGQTHFYLERPFEQEAIAAIDSAITFETSGSQRFAKIQDFLHTCTHQYALNNASDEPHSPQFFCSFTFFDQPTEAHSPFPAARVFLPRWQIVRRQNTAFARANLTIHPHLNLEHSTDELWQQFQSIRLANYGRFNLIEDLNSQLKPWKIVDSHSFANTVRLALHSIHQKHLRKLVLAHTIDVTSRLPFDWIYSLHRLRQLYPDCYIFSTGNGGDSTFLGASPERLIRARQHQLETDALAGSAPRGTNAAQDAHFAQQLLSSQKERHEHQLVVDFIRDRLKLLGLAPQLATLPELLKLSNIQHLHTPIQAVLPSALHPLEVLAELHPTPAVAGLPRDLACQEIQRYEPVGRSLYAAPLGWVDLRGNAEFLVGIRSALIQGNHARLFAGAGIVTGSNPNREQAEVHLKLQALLNALI